MEFLPLKMVEMIAQQLSPRDLAACCATSHSWRDLFNQDLFWKHLTNQDTADYLSRTPCRVEPAFISPEVEGSGLDPVCQWRMNYMRENHLLNNWRSGRYQEEKLPFLCEKKLNIYQEEFVIDMRCERKVSEYEMKVIIGDLRCDPVIYIDDPCPLIPFSDDSMLVCHYMIFVCGKRLVVIQRSAVSVFKINLMTNKWPLEHIFIYEEDKPTDFIRALNATNQTDRRSVLYFISIVGNYLLAINLYSKWNLHIWDIVYGLKMKKEALDNRESAFYTLKASKTSLNDIIVVLSMTGSLFTKVYSLLTFTYYPCVFEGVKYCNLQKDKIVLNMKIPSDHWLIVNYKTGEQIREIKGIGSLSRCLEVFDNKAIYFNASGVNQINLSTGERKQLLDVRGIVNYFEVWGDKFIFMIVHGNEDLRFHGIFLSDLGIWKMHVSKRLATVFNHMRRIDCYKTNTTLTKMILKFSDQASVVSFW